MTEEQAVNTEVVEQEAPQAEPVVDAMDELFGNRYPLSNMGEETPEPPAVEEETKVEAEPETTSEPVAEEPKPVVKDETAGLQAALLAERQKRQAAEAQLAEKPVEKETFDWDDPDKTLERMESKFEAKFQQQFLSMSESQCRSRYGDYDEKYQVFVGMAQENPAVVNAMLQQADPAEYAYQLAKQKMFTDEVGSDPAAYEEKLRAKVRAEVEAEYNQKIKDKIDLAGSLPPSAKGMADKIPPKIVLTDPMDDLFKDVPGG